MEKDLIPFLGNKSVLKRLRELDRELVSLLVVISIGFSKFFEGIVEIFISRFPVIIAGVDISMPLWYLIYSAFWLILYLYEVDRKTKDALSSVELDDD